MEVLPGENLTARPILLFAYRKVQFLDEILSKIIEYEPRKLYISLNAPSSEQEFELTNEVRKTIMGYRFRFETEILDHKSHLSLNEVFHTSLDYVADREDAFMVLEDDTIPSAGFFTFCDKMLYKYRDDQGVGCINGCNLNAIHQNDSYFLSRFSIPFWGWATWSNRWANAPMNLDFWSQMRSTLDFNEAFILGKIDRFVNINEVWDMRWAAFLLSQGKKTVLSGVNLVRNLGYNEHASFCNKADSKYSGLTTSESSVGDIDDLNLIEAETQYFKEVISFLKEFE